MRLALVATPTENVEIMGMVMETGESLFTMLTPWTSLFLWSKLGQVYTNKWLAFDFNKEELTLTVNILVLCACCSLTS